MATLAAHSRDANIAAALGTAMKDAQELVRGRMRPQSGDTVMYGARLGVKRGIPMSRPDPTVDLTDRRVPTKTLPEACVTSIVSGTVAQSTAALAMIAKGLTSAVVSSKHKQLLLSHLHKAGALEVVFKWVTPPDQGPTIALERVRCAHALSVLCAACNPVIAADVAPALALLRTTGGVHSVIAGLQCTHAGIQLGALAVIVHGFQRRDLVHVLEHLPLLCRLATASSLVDPSVEQQGADAQAGALARQILERALRDKMLDGFEARRAEDALAAALTTAAPAAAIVNGGSCTNNRRTASSSARSDPIAPLDMPSAEAGLLRRWPAHRAAPAGPASFPPHTEQRSGARRVPPHELSRAERGQGHRDGHVQLMQRQGRQCLGVDLANAMLEAASTAPEGLMEGAQEGAPSVLGFTDDRRMTEKGWMRLVHQATTTLGLYSKRLSTDPPEGETAKGARRAAGAAGGREPRSGEYPAAQEADMGDDDVLALAMRPLLSLFRMASRDGTRPVDVPTLLRLPSTIAYLEAAIESCCLEAVAAPACPTPSPTAPPPSPPHAGTKPSEAVPSAGVGATRHDSCMGAFTGAFMGSHRTPPRLFPQDTAPQGTPGGSPRGTHRPPFAPRSSAREGAPAQTEPSCIPSSRAKRAALKPSPPHTGSARATVQFAWRAHNHKAAANKDMREVWGRLKRCHERHGQRPWERPRLTVDDKEPLVCLDYLPRGMRSTWPPPGLVAIDPLKAR